MKRIILILYNNFIRRDLLGLQLQFNRMYGSEKMNRRIQHHERVMYENNHNYNLHNHNHKLNLKHNYPKVKRN